MKKLILSLLATGTIVSANAQQPNSFLLYGDVGFHTNTDARKDNTMNWNVAPGIGYQFNNAWTVGINLAWSQTSTKDSGSSDRASTNMYSVGPFVRYSSYIASSNMFFWFGQLNVGYQGGYSTFGSMPSFNKNSGFYASIIPALGINVGHGLALNFAVGGIGYNNVKYKEAGNPNNGFDFNFGQEFTFGISKNFGCHHMHGHHEPGEEMRHIDTSDNDDEDAPKKHHRHHKSDNDDNDE